MQVETTQHFLGAGEHALVLVLALLRRGDRDELHLGELMLADHAARVLAGSARLGTKARGAGGEPQRELGLVDDLVAHQIGQRHLGGGDEPKSLYYLAHTIVDAAANRPSVKLLYGLIEGFLKNLGICCNELIILELRQLRRAEHGGVAHEQWWRDF